MYSFQQKNIAQIRNVCTAYYLTWAKKVGECQKEDEPHSPLSVH